MPRRPRSFLPEIPVHVIQRGNNKCPCFFARRDFIIYLAKLAEYARHCDVALHSYVLMTNHVHLLMTPRHPDGPSQLMQMLGRYYVRYINSTYSRTGTLWEGRFKASLIDSDAYLLTVSRYIELNPVRAGMVNHPADYPWSSYRMNAMGTRISMLTPHPLYLTLGSDDSSRQRAYRSLFADTLPEPAIHQIRAAANKAGVLGDASFKQKVEQQLGHALPPFAHGGDRRQPRTQLAASSYSDPLAPSYSDPLDPSC